MYNITRKRNCTLWKEEEDILWSVGLSFMWGPYSAEHAEHA